MYKLLVCIFLVAKPSSFAGIRFLELLKEDEMAFDNLYCVAFQMMDAQWLAKRASYMEFNVKSFHHILVYKYQNLEFGLTFFYIFQNLTFFYIFQDVLKSTRTQLERELALEDVINVKDLPAYNLLRRWILAFLVCQPLSILSCSNSCYNICRLLEPNI